MKIESFILSILKKVESMKEGVVAYSYKTGNAPMTHVWWEISVSDFDLYMNDKGSRLYRMLGIKLLKLRVIKSYLFAVGYLLRKNLSN